MATRRDWLRQHLPEFIREYGRTSRRGGLDPNDRHYDRQLEREIKRMDPRELDRLLRDDEDGVSDRATTGALQRFWIEFDWPSHPRAAGVVLDSRQTWFGVTAFDLDDAVLLIQTEYFDWLDVEMPPIRTVTESVDVSTLREEVVLNMSPPNWRGIWFPQVRPLN